VTKKILALASLLALTLVGVAIAASGTPSPEDDNIKGTAGNDTISAQSGNDKVSGRGGDDTLNGDDGNDRVKGDAGEDNVNGGSGNDKLSGGKDDDEVNGDAGNDRLRGDKGDDDLDGGEGDDRLKGGRGADELDGGDGADRIDAKGGGRKSGPDEVDCGAGDGDVDHVRADRNDTVTGCGPEDKVKQKGRPQGDEDQAQRRANRRAHPRHDS